MELSNLKRKDMMAEMEVLHPGLFSSIQDLGRFGFMEYGVPVSGAMDSNAFRVANLLLKNPKDAAVLEITQMGPRLSFSEETQIAVTGAHLSPAINGQPIENNKAYTIFKDQILSFKKRIYGCRSYLAVKGGFRSEKVLNSRSWYDGLTGYLKIEKGMKIPYESGGDSFPDNYSGIKTPDYINSKIVEAFQGPEFENLSEAQRRRLFNDEFSLDQNNNRMGIQFGELLENSLEPILTGPVLPGTVQLTPSGKLIALMRDGQTTGGYPRILQLSENGLNTLAQKVTGEKIRFDLL